MGSPLQATSAPKISSALEAWSSFLEKFSETAKKADAAGKELLLKKYTPLKKHEEVLSKVSSLIASGGVLSANDLLLIHKIDTVFSRTFPQSTAPSFRSLLPITSVLKSWDTFLEMLSKAATNDAEKKVLLARYAPEQKGNAVLKKIQTLITSGNTLSPDDLALIKKIDALSQQIFPKSTASPFSSLIPSVAPPAPLSFTQVLINLNRLTHSLPYGAPLEDLLSLARQCNQLFELKFLPSEVTDSNSHTLSLIVIKLTEHLDAHLKTMQSADNEITQHEIDDFTDIMNDPHTPQDDKGEFKKIIEEFKKKLVSQDTFKNLELFKIEFTTNSESFFKRFSHSSPLATMLRLNKQIYPICPLEKSISGHTHKRRIGGDGNCFFYSFIAEMFDPSAPTKGEWIDIINDTPGRDVFIDEHVKSFIMLLKSLKSREERERLLQDSEFTYALMIHLRDIAADYLMKNQSTFEEEYRMVFSCDEDCKQDLACFKTDIYNPTHPERQTPWKDLVDKLVRTPGIYAHQTGIVALCHALKYPIKIYDNISGQTWYGRITPDESEEKWVQRKSQRALSRSRGHYEVIYRI
jgi:hypothetical protein